MFLIKKQKTLKTLTINSKNNKRTSNNDKNHVDIHKCIAEVLQECFLRKKIAWADTRTYAEGRE